MGLAVNSQAGKFKPGDRVTVKLEARPGHIRTPWYVRGKPGWIERVYGDFLNPESLAYGRDGLPKRTLYLVAFNQADVWGRSAGPTDKVLVDKGVLAEKDIQCQVEYQEARSPANGSKLVAHAWVDSAFKARLISDPKAACAEMGIDAAGVNEFVVLENTEKVRHMVVCTLRSEEHTSELQSRGHLVCRLLL